MAETVAGAATVPCGALDPAADEISDLTMFLTKDPSRDTAAGGRDGDKDGGMGLVTTLAADETVAVFVVPALLVETVEVEEDEAAVDILRNGLTTGDTKSEMGKDQREKRRFFFHHFEQYGLSPTHAHYSSGWVAHIAPASEFGAVGQPPTHTGEDGPSD